jgi:hypothetical protein
MILAARELRPQDLDRFLRLPALDPDHPQRRVRHGLRRRETPRRLELLLRVGHEALHREEDAALQPKDPGIRELAEADVHDLETEVEVVVLDADGREVDVVLRRLRLEPRGLAQRVVGLLDAAGAHEGARGQVVQLGGGPSFRDQLLGHADRARVVAGLDEHQGLVVPGHVRILVALARGGEQPRRIRVRARLPERHPRVEPSHRVLGRDAVEDGRRVTGPTGRDQRGAVVRGPHRVLGESGSRLLVMREGGGRLLRAVVELGQIEVRDLVRGRELQRLREVGARVRVAAGVVFVDAEVLQGRIEAGIEGQRFRKRALAASRRPAPVSAMPYRFRALRSRGEAAS